MASLSSKVYLLAAKIIKLKRFWEGSEEEFCARMAKHHPKKSKPLDIHHQKYAVKKDFLGEDCYQIKPKKGKIKCHILYLPGGGYVNPITSLHWLFLFKLVNKAKAKITVFNYPLAPSHHLDESYAILTKIYKNISEKEDITIMGDSAGGGFALGFSQYVRNLGMKVPVNTILLSPFLDVTCTDPLIKVISKIDPFLFPDGLTYAARLYANGIDLQDYRISPIYGDLAGLGKITIVTGTCDILHADAKRINGMLESNLIEHNYFSYQDLIHCFMFTTTKEANLVIKSIVKILHQEVAVPLN